MSEAPNSPLGPDLKAGFPEEAELALEQRPAAKRPARPRHGQPAAGPGRAG